MRSVPLLDCAGRRRSPATLSGFDRGLPPRNKGLRYPPDPPTIEEIIGVMRAAGDRRDGPRLRGVIVVLWRAGPRISEALALQESDLDQPPGAVLVRRGNGGKRREVGMDRWARDQLEPWLGVRAELPVGALFCVLRGPTRGRACSPTAIRAQSRNLARAAGVRRRFAPHQLRRARRRDVPRRRAGSSHTAPARPRRPRDHIRRPARDRQHGDHPRRPRTTSSHDPGHHQPQTDALTPADPSRPSQLQPNRPSSRPSDRRRRGCGRDSQAVSAPAESNRG